ncbi:MAG: response regulator [Solirubrobacteraceae bacterium]
MSATVINDSESRPTPAAARDEAAPGAEPAVAVMIVDDDRAASYSLWALLNWQPGIRICATASSAVEAVKLVRRRKPGVCLVSAALEAGEGVHPARRLMELPEPPRVILYADRLGRELEAVAAITGAAGAVGRYGDPGQLACTIRRTAAGEHGLPTVSANAIGELIDLVEGHDRPIATMLLQRISPDEIARTLGISGSNVRTRRGEILKRLEQSCFVTATTGGR